MLIVNDDHLRLAGIASLEEPCPYCSKTLAAYPLIMTDDVDQTVYHVTCALELASDLLADVFTFFSKRKGHLLALVRGWGRWYSAESVRIERTGQELLL